MWLDGTLEFYLHPGSNLTIVGDGGMYTDLCNLTLVQFWVDTLPLFNIEILGNLTELARGFYLVSLFNFKIQYIKKFLIKSSVIMSALSMYHILPFCKVWLQSDNLTYQNEFSEKILLTYNVGRRPSKSMLGKIFHNFKKNLSIV